MIEALRLYAVLLLLVRYGFMNSEAVYNFTSSLTRTK